MGGLAPPNLPARALPLHSLKELLRHNIPFKPQVPASWANRWDYLIIFAFTFSLFLLYIKGRLHSCFWNAVCPCLLSVESAARYHYPQSCIWTENVVK